MDSIRGGYILQPRCIQDSWIAQSSPVVRETWAYLLRTANHKDNKYNGFTVKRGQLFVSFNDIRDALKWYKGCAIERYTVNQMKHTMKLLRIHLMIDLTSQPRGNLVTICNYDFYQNPNNYESTSHSTNDSTSGQPVVNQTSPAINKNVKNVKKTTTVLQEKPARPQVPFSQIVSFLNEKSGKEFKDNTASTKKIILARWKEGFTLEDFKRVISDKVGEWHNDPKMAKYIRPQTLFGDKFDSYLQESGNIKNSVWE